MLKILCLLSVYIVIVVNASDLDAIKFPDNKPDDNTRMERNYFHQHQHPHHSHRDDSRKSVMLDQHKKEIPLELIQKLNGIDDLQVLFDNYLEGEEKFVEEVAVASRFGSVERAAAVIPKPATCKPTLQTVELKNTNDTSLFYFPSCTRIERCNGCCSHSLLSCQPTETELVSFQVFVSQYTGGSKLDVKGKETVLIEKHTKCKCDCTVKPEHCNSFQEYRKNECRCMCTNQDEMKKCEKKWEMKLWDPVICKCQCREIKECTSGLYFDQNKCECVQIPVRRRFAELDSKEDRAFSDRELYKVDALTVGPIGESSDEAKTKENC